jgi:nitrile hydratase accessory protein
MTPELDIDGPAAPPRANGELSFEYPWQRRVFATTMALCETGRLDYSVFRDRLIAETTNNDRHHADDYWGAWQNALETLITKSGLIDAEELEHRARRFAQHH